MTDAATKTVPSPGRVAKTRYVSPEFAHLEEEHLWSRVWQHGGSLDLLTEPGAFITTVLGGGVNAIIMRGQDGVLRAFENVCLHRGRRLISERCGREKMLRCPMHHWQYRTDGALGHVPDREEFGDLLDGDLGLRELATGTWGGQVWVHIGEPEESLEEWLAPVIRTMEKFDFENYALCEWDRFEVACNWKTCADVFNEVYHLQGVHPNLLFIVDDTLVETERHGNHMFATWPFARQSSRLKPSSGISPQLAGYLESELKVDVAALDNDPARIPEGIIASMRARGLEHFTDEELVTASDYYVFPGFAITAYAHMMHIHRYCPHPTDPDRMYLDAYQLVRVWPGEERPQVKMLEGVRPGDSPSPGPSFEEDIDACVEVQAGMRTPGFEHLLLGSLEARILHMHTQIDRYISEGTEKS